MRAYYNEWDKNCAAWIRQLIKNGNITPGEVDERSITDVRPDDLKGFNRHHFFGGIAVWDYALNCAGWGDRPVWTASLPCQPFSAAGKKLGIDDERHLLPHFLDLVRECRPSTIFGEQVPGAIKFGWLDSLYTEMEAHGYAVGTLNIGAHSAGSFHIRQRLYWVADTINAGSQGGLSGRQDSEREIINGCAGRNGATNGMGDTEGERWHFCDTENNRPTNAQGGASANSHGCVIDESSGVNTSSHDGLQWIYCRDNKYRPVKPGIFPLAPGIARGVVYSSDPGAPIDANNTQEARVMRLKGYGNAIQAQTAMLFIKAFKG